MKTEGWTRQKGKPGETIILKMSRKSLTKEGKRKHEEGKDL